MSKKTTEKYYCDICGKEMNKIAAVPTVKNITGKTRKNGCYSYNDICEQCGEEITITVNHRIEKMLKKK